MQKGLTEPTPAATPPPRWVLRLAGPFALLSSMASALLVQRAMLVALQPDVSLERAWTSFSCTFPGHGARALSIYMAQANWSAMFALESVVGAIGLACAAAVIIKMGGNEGLWRRPEWWFVLTAGFAALAYDAASAWNMRRALHLHFFLSDLLSSLPKECNYVRDNVVYAKLVGEGAGIVIGVAMAVSVAFVRPPTPAELASRIERLQRLLYVASLLFVAGLLMTRANFSLVLSRWNVDDKAIAALLADVVKAGVVQSGVGYSALLAAFFMPARAVLGWFVETTLPPEARDDVPARTKWLDAQGLSRSWQADAKQILALLAPALSAPLFDALVKST